MHGRGAYMVETTQDIAYMPGKMVSQKNCFHQSVPKRAISEQYFFTQETKSAAIYKDTDITQPMPTIYQILHLPTWLRSPQRHALLHTTTPAEHTLHLPCHWKLRCTCHTVTRNRTSNKKRRREMHALCGLHQGTKENQQTTQQKRPETQHAPLHTTTPAEHTLHLPCHWKLRCTCHTVTRNRTSNKKRRRELRTLYRLHQTTDEDQQTTQRKRPASQARLRASQASQNYGHKRGTDPSKNINRDQESYLWFQYLSQSLSDMIINSWICR